MKISLIIGVMAAIVLNGSTSFAQEAAPAAPSNSSWLTYKNPYAGEEDSLAKPHRTPDEITAWAQEAATDVLSFGKEGYREKLNGFKKFFVPEGWQLYAAYLKDTQLINMVVDSGYSVSTIVDNAPEILSHGSSAGTYHWIVKAPITVGFFSVSTTGENVAGPSHKYTLFMDIKRVEKKDSGDDVDHGLAITNWRVDETSGG